MVTAEPDFCGLYTTKTKCHDMPELNCYSCGCPYFIFDDQGLEHKDGKVVYSKCTINAKEGATFESAEAIHMDCSNCTVPHTTTATLKELKGNK